MTFTTEIALDVEVEIVGGHRGRSGRSGAHPVEPDPGEIEVAVWLIGESGERLELTAHLPAEVLEALEVDAAERLKDQ